MELFFGFLFLHCLADYPLQGDFIAKMKGKNSILMIAHCAIWTGMIGVGLKHYGFLEAWHLPFLFIGHYAIDSWKCSRSGNGKELGPDLALDQFGHFLQIAFVLLV